MCYRVYYVYVNAIYTDTVTAV